MFNPGHNLDGICQLQEPAWEISFNFGNFGGTYPVGV